jgi:hypothetical protein
MSIYLNAQLTSQGRPKNWNREVTSTWKISRVSSYNNCPVTNGV